MKFLQYLAYALVLIGALNWGLVGLFNFDLVAKIFGDMTILTRTIYTLVGLSAIITGIVMRHCETRDRYDTCEYGNCHM